MPPRRRNKATSARSAAIQAVRRRQGDEESSSSESFHHNHHHQHYPSGKQNNNHNATEEEEDNDSDVPALLDHDPEDIADTESDHKDEDDASEDEDGCLHCHVQSTDIQVHCDECQAYICQTCHWCHEFQANHEIRVCDRCDAFYCRHCDEMDQCDDCGEVVCASCSTLLSCKFCGGGLCEECATACGRCGIVLCSRDAKFAVDCDTCRLSYCLVCLASGSKDPCVRCGHRPSKRMEQLVHLRLKSIYKAFKQSSSSSSSKNHHHHHHHGKNTTTIEELEDNEDDDDVPDLEVDNSILLAAAAAKQHATNYMNSPRSTSSHKKKVTQDVLAKRYIQEKQKADEAAEALLAELEEEEEAVKSKKSKKKRKKERHVAAKREEEENVRQEEQEKAKKAAAKNSKAKAKERPPPKEEKELPKAVDEDKVQPSPSLSVVPEEPTSKVDDIETRLVQLVDGADIEGIETMLFELKGVPGRAVLRKNAKKALKRLRCSQPEATEEQDVDAMALTNSYNYKNDFIPHRSKEGMQQMHVPTTSTGELLKVVSDTNAAKSNRAECVMQMSPCVVGWVIGKGGQRIRDLMEESGAKVWIDQEKAKPQECRNVYVSGERKSVDVAVKMVKDIVAKAPIGQQLQQQQHDQQQKLLRHQDATVEKDETPVSPATTPNVPPATTALAADGLVSGVPASSNLPLQQPPKPSVPAVEQRTDPVKITETAQPVPAMSTGAPVPPSTARAPMMATVPGPNSFPASIDQEGFAQHVLTCEARFVPLLIGKRGWTIKSIQDESGARVDIDQTVTPRQITISGSASNVETAIGMVRDVLSYPHAQLQTQQHSPALVEGAPEDGAYSHPSSLAIVTGDAKSMISASSSLSSTPEPSMASTTKSHPLPTFPLIPPEYGAVVNNNHMPGAPPQAFLPIAGDAGGNGVHPPPRFGGGPPFLMGVQQQRIAGMVMPTHQQQQHPPMYNPGAPHGVKDRPVPAGFSPALHNQPSAPLDFVMGGGRSNEPVPGMQHGFMNHPAGPTSQQYNQYNDMPSENGLRNSLPVENAATKQSHGLWNPSRAYQGGGPHPKQPAPGGYYDGTIRSGSALPLFEHSQAAVGQSQAPFSSLSSTSAAAPIGLGRDDALMVDSLFAPMGNPTPSDPQENLLMGLKGLSISSNDGLGGGAGSGGGLWGPSSLADWELNKQEGGAASNPSNDPMESALLSGLQPLQTQAQESTQHHPAQSRFKWNA
jgi:hypothetical protein